MADKLSRNMRVSMKRPQTEFEAEQLVNEMFKMHQHPQHALEEMLRTRKLEVGAVEWVYACMLMRCAGLRLFALR